MTTSTIRRMQAEANAARQGLKRSLERSSSMPAKAATPASTEEIGSELHIAQREPNLDGQYPNCYVDVKTGEPFSGPPEGYIIAEGTASSPDEVDARAIANADAEGDELNDVLDRKATPWIPEEGDRIFGKVLAVYEVESVNERKPMVPALELQTKSGAIFEFRAYFESAQSQLERHKPQVGDWLGIHYLGRVPSQVKNHKPYYNFRMAVKRGGAA